MKSILRRGRADDAASTIERASRLEAKGRHLEVVDLLTAANRKQPSAELETRLVRARNQAFVELGVAGTGYPDAAPIEASKLPDDAGVPSVSVAELNPSLLRGAILQYGCLIVRGLVGAERADELKTGIDHAFSARDAHLAGADSSETTPWYQPFEPDPEYADSVEFGRRFVGKGSGVWTADSPRLLFQLLDTYEQAGIREVITGYLGERPAISVNKGTLRRAAPKVGTEWWHQDGAFLGAGIRSMNIWLSLTDSGIDAPGLEVVPKRLESIVDKGTEGADFDWSVGDAVVERVSGGVLSRPVFRPGDAMLFDHLFLHRTGSDPTMTKTRYATETWFFAPSAYPDPQDQVPLAF